MAITFPSSPSDQDTYTYAGKTYIYNASRSQWQVVSTTVANADLSSVMTNIVPASNVAYSLGTAEKAWSDLYVSGNTIHLGSTSLSVDAEGGLQTSVGGQAVKIGGGVEIYANTGLMPLSGVDTGAQAYSLDTNRLYIWNGNGWFSIALVNQTPNITQGADASFRLNTDGSPTTVTLQAEDPEGFPLTWSYQITSGSLGNTATISQSNNVFTITPSSNTAHAGSFTVTFSATDGVNIATSQSVVSLQFTAAGTGGTISVDGDYDIHVFSANGTFTLDSVAPDTNYTMIEYLCLAGGGGGGVDRYSQVRGAGGGGAGGYLVGSFALQTGNTATIVVGEGGQGGLTTDSPHSVIDGKNGANSSITVNGQTITAIGGGGGGGHTSPTHGSGGAVGFAGGSGGGGTNGSAGGAGTPGQGNNGGTGGGSPYDGGHGGGFGSAGGLRTGGVGIVNGITGTDVTYAAGGATWGGNGFSTPNTNAGGGSALLKDAPAGFGGGGGALRYDAAEQAGNGGSGVVILKYRQTQLANTAAPLDSDVAHYSLDNVLTESINGQDLIFPNTMNFTTSFKKVGTHSGYVNTNAVGGDIPDLYTNAGLRFPFSVSAWVYKTASAGSQALNMVANHSYNGQRISMGFVNWLTGYDEATIMYGGSNHWTFSFGSAVPENEWMHIVYTVWGSNNSDHAVYINGVQTTTVTNRGGTHGGTASWKIAGSSNTAEYFRGYIDNIRWHNVALDESAANALYQLEL